MFWKNKRPMMDDRLTRCPNCKTSFKISRQELQQAYGAARCGRCKKIFNAGNHLLPIDINSIRPLNAAPHNARTPARADKTNNTSRLTENATGLKPAVTSEKQATATASPRPPAEQRPKPVTPAPQQPAEKNRAPEQTASSGTSTEKPDQAKADAVKAHLERMPDTPPLEMPPEELATIRQARQSKIARQRQVQRELNARRDDDVPELRDDLHFSATTDEPDFSAPDKSPAAEREKQHQRKPAAGNNKPAGLLFSALAVAILSLILLLAWANTRTMSQTPGLSDVAEALCQLSSCDHLLGSDFAPLQAGQLALIEQDQQQKAELILLNPGDIPLPFPALLLEFRNEQQQIITERLHQPDDYLKNTPFADGILPVQLPVTLTLPVRQRLGEVSHFSVVFLPPAD